MKTGEFETEVVNGFTYITAADGRRLQVPSGGSPEGDEDGTKDTEGDTGGVGKEDTADDTLEASEEERGTGERDADETGEKKTGNAGLQKRLKNVIKERNDLRETYKEFGTPTELRALKAKVAEVEKYEKQIADEEQEAADAAAVKAGRPTVAQQNAALDRMLDQRFGEGAAESFERFRTTEKREIARHTRDGLNRLRHNLVEHNLKTDDESVEGWEVHVGTEFKRDPELRARFRDPVTADAAIDEAFTRVRRTLIDPSLAAVGAEKLSKFKARKDAAPGAGGAGGGTQLEHFENLTPPKGLNADQRAAWWSTQLNSAADAMDW